MDPLLFVDPDVPEKIEAQVESEIEPEHEAMPRPHIPERRSSTGHGEVPDPAPKDQDESCEMDLIGCFYHDLDEQLRGWRAPRAPHRRGLFVRKRAAVQIIIDALEQQATYEASEADLIITYLECHSNEILTPADLLFHQNYIQAVLRDMLNTNIIV